MSLPSVAWPRTTEPKMRTSLAPCLAEIRRISSRRLRMSSMVTIASLALRCAAMVTLSGVATRGKASHHAASR